MSDIFELRSVGCNVRPQTDVAMPSANSEHSEHVNLESIFQM